MTTCNGPGGLFTVTGSGTWNLNGTSDTVGGVTPGSITGVNAHVAGDCSFDVTGSVDGTYTNGLNTGTGTLTLPGTTSTLTISNTSLGCVFVGVQSGDSASFKATYQVVADNGAYNPIQITSNP